MKTVNSIKKVFAASLFLFGFAANVYSQTAYNNVWVRANACPTDGGVVFVDWYIDEVNYADVSEFKRSASLAASTGYILAKPASGYLYAGVARDMNGNGKYDAGIDRQVHVWFNYYFDCFYDHTDYFVSGSSTQSQELAEEALAKMTQPTDLVLAIFTKGDVAKRAEGEEARGFVFSSKLDNQPGDQVTFYAYGDSEYTNEGNIYYKFDHWTNAAGEEVSRDREFTVTVSGGQTYSAHFVETTKKDFKETETVPSEFKFDYNNPDWDWDWLSVESVKSAATASSVIYDLQGRRVTKPQKGLFIQNGKKMIVR